MHQASTTTIKQQTFSKQDKDVIAYFFLRLQNTYGIAKMQSQWPDSHTLSLARREFGKSISRLSREQINALFDVVHDERQKGNDKFLFPDIDAILGLQKQNARIASYHKLYIPHQLAPREAQDRRKANIIALDKMRKELNI
jgi:hypothetical protein